jgi:hypothetical protein
MRLYNINRHVVDASRCYSDTFTPYIKSRIISAFKIYNESEEDEYEIAFSLCLYKALSSCSRVVVNFDTHEICFLSEAIYNSYHKHNKYFLKNRKRKYIYNYTTFKNCKFETRYRMRYTLIKSKKLKWKLGWVVK